MQIGGGLKSRVSAAVTVELMNPGIPDSRTLDLRLDNDNVVRLTEQQIADVDLRLAYVQHPFPAQGQTTDTTHLIIGERATREGTYVGLTRARESTDIYAAEAPDPIPKSDRLQDLAQHMNRPEPDLPSIHTPLAHETAVATVASIDTALSSETRTLTHELNLDTHADGDQPQIDKSTRPRTRKPTRCLQPATTAVKAQPTSTASKRYTGTPSAGPVRSQTTHRRTWSVPVAVGRECGPTSHSHRLTKKATNPTTPSAWNRDHTPRASTSCMPDTTSQGCIPDGPPLTSRTCAMTPQRSSRRAIAIRYHRPRRREELSGPSGMPAKLPRTTTYLVSGLALPPNLVPI